MPHLPHELVEEILSRVPATSLKRLRSICRQWKSLFKDRRFTEKNFRKAPKQSLVLLVMLMELITFSISDSLNVADLSSIEFKVPFGLENSLSNLEKVVEVFHCCSNPISNNCGGLLLCTTSLVKLVVWNQCLGETRWIQPIRDYNRWSRYSLGYENNKSCHSYKILSYHHVNDNLVGYEIYDFNSDSWRVLVDVVVLDCLIEPSKVLHRIYGASKMDMWVTNNIDSEAVVWSKSFTIDIQPIHLENLTYIPSSFVMDEEKKVVVCCNASKEPTSVQKEYVIEKYHTESPFIVETTQVSCCPLIFSYVPSFVRVQQVRRKRKERN
ncbi:hypothetical protein EUTSA_v10017637mg [Eutrema salsugineum]|uniref:F-box domain-containing protein n=1 Tax=Eutrema salsugineum TaxID=72664 RepID=V4MFW0_EUTSA|nr:hypothetical protein EUTSA_v10017637mg [Eutrema salsugineum]